MNKQTKPHLWSGILVSILLAFFSIALSRLASLLLSFAMKAIFHIEIADDLVEPSIFALVIGMLLNKQVSRFSVLKPGIQFVSKYILRTAIVLLGLTLSFSQVFSVGKISLIVMSFTLFTSFVIGNLLGRLFGVNWRLSALLSAGTGICGGSAIAALAPVIEAEDSDVTFALSSTYLFDVIMVILFPFIGRFLGMTDAGFGVWAGTSVNDTSSVVAAGYAFSQQAGDVAVIVKLTRTLSIVPVVLIFSYINARVKAKALSAGGEIKAVKVNWKKVFPFFILLFLAMVAIKSTGIVPAQMNPAISTTTKFLMLVALAAIGMKTSKEDFADKGKKPLIFAIGIDILVTIVAYVVQVCIHAT
ncbi:YeiH family protein [Scatolibacter rhodanostii]|uniref:YeiH family protein n=1 Tax=Scatolibacter rhodanostii TaxID=2014781 RepID=UPI000C083CC5|nr:putative sulfate exporter family transporter [Scatolibacter rhodanostii]